MPYIVDAEVETLEMKDRSVRCEPRRWQFDLGTEFEDRNARHGARLEPVPAQRRGSAISG